jgi:hypothetical protein
VEWDERALKAASVIMFWVPRSHDLPGLTTNIEFGMWMDSGKVVFGAPANADDVKYMRWWCAKLGIAQADTLEGTIHRAIMLATEREAAVRSAF